MDDQRVGRVVRTLRRRLGWRQTDLAEKAKCSQSLVSLVERGHLDRLSNRALRRILAVVDARAAIVLTWRAGDLDRLLDEDHARVVGAVAQELRALGWIVQTEVTYARYRERGSYDIIAFHPGARLLLVVEVKTDLPSAEQTLRKLDEKVRLAAGVARERFSWQARGVARLLVLPEDRTLRRRVERHANLLDGALQLRSVAVRKWLAAPDAPMSGLWFLTVTNQRSPIQKPGGRSRVRAVEKLADRTATG